MFSFYVNYGNSPSLFWFKHCLDFKGQCFHPVIDLHQMKLHRQQLQIFQAFSHYCFTYSNSVSSWNCLPISTKWAQEDITKSKQGKNKEGNFITSDWFPIRFVIPMRKLIFIPRCGKYHHCNISNFSKNTCYPKREGIKYIMVCSIYVKLQLPFNS